MEKLNTEIKLKKLITLAAFVFFSIESSVAAVIVALPDRDAQEKLLDQAHIEIVGEIVEGDFERLKKAINQHKNRFDHSTKPLILLNSPGGNVLEALAMGRLLRSILAVTIVDSNSDCNSACVFLLASGVQRVVFGNGRIGLHRPRFGYDIYGNMNPNEAQQSYSALVQKCTVYMSDMGIPPRVFESMLNTPSQEILFIDSNVGEKIGLLGNDPAWEEWDRARRINMQGLEKVEAFDRMLSCVGSGVNHLECDRKYRSEIRSIK